MRIATNNKIILSKSWHSNIIWTIMCTLQSSKFRFYCIFICYSFCSTGKMTPDNRITIKM